MAALALASIGLPAGAQGVGEDFSSAEAQAVASYLQGSGRQASDRFCWLERICSAGAGLGQGNACEGTLLSCLSYQAAKAAPGAMEARRERLGHQACAKLTPHFTPLARQLISAPRGCGEFPARHGDKPTLTAAEAQCLAQKSCSYASPGSAERQGCVQNLLACTQSLTNATIRTRSECRRSSAALFAVDDAGVAAKYGCRRDAAGSMPDVWTAPAGATLVRRGAGGAGASVFAGAGATSRLPPPKNWEEQVDRLERTEESDDFADF